MLQVRITSKGQVTIPQGLREQFGLLPNTEVEFVATPDGKELRLLKSSKPLQGDVKKLEAKGNHYRLRIGSHRVLFTLADRRLCCQRQKASV